MKSVRDLTAALLVVLALGCQGDTEWTQPRAVDEMQSESMSDEPDRWADEGGFVGPTSEEFRRWARDQASDEHLNVHRLFFTQDADLLVTRLERGPLFVELADSDAPERMVSLRCLYLLTWQCMGYEQQRARLEPLFERVPSRTSAPDVVRWMERSKDVVKRNRSSGIRNGDWVHDDWTRGGLADR